MKISSHMVIPATFLTLCAVVAGLAYSGWLSDEKPDDFERVKTFCAERGLKPVGNAFCRDPATRLMYWALDN